MIMENKFQETVISESLILRFDLILKYTTDCHFYDPLIPKIIHYYFAEGNWLF